MDGSASLPPLVGGAGVVHGGMAQEPSVVDGAGALLLGAPWASWVYGAIAEVVKVGFANTSKHVSKGSDGVTIENCTFFRSLDTKVCVGVCSSP